MEAGCTSIEHGTFLDDATLQLMAARCVYFATSVSADSLGMGDRIGSLAAGMEADIVAILRAIRWTTSPLCAK